MKMISECFNIGVLGLDWQRPRRYRVYTVFVARHLIQIEHSCVSSICIMRIPIMH